MALLVGFEQLDPTRAPTRSPKVRCIIKNVVEASVVVAAVVDRERFQLHHISLVVVRLRWTVKDRLHNAGTAALPRACRSHTRPPSAASVVSVRR